MLFPNHCHNCMWLICFMFSVIQICAVRKKGQKLQNLKCLDLTKIICLSCCSYFKCIPQEFLQINALSNEGYCKIRIHFCSTFCLNLKFLIQIIQIAFRAAFKSCVINEFALNLTFIQCKNKATKYYHLDSPK